jgi:aldehyde:ferredoxin oxidoreductase
MSTFNGFNGKLLRVDLTSGVIVREDIPEVLFRKYLGGGTLGLYYLMNGQPAGVDPLSPENQLIFMASAVTGTPGLGLSRFSVVSKSPLTGLFGESEAGGWWGPELKFSGYDGIIFTGRAESPVYLSIQNGQAELRDARGIWGLNTGEAVDAIIDELGDPKTRIAIIGPGGEKLTRYACILNELKHANGRTGMGAVMGSKNLKAVAVRGTEKMNLADPEKTQQIVKALAASYKENPGTMTKLGTARGIRGQINAGTMPTLNFKQGNFDEFEGLTAETMIDSMLSGRGTCYRCYIRCKREVSLEKPYKVDPRYGGPEYETLGSFGTLCGISDMKAVAYANQLCQQYSIDTISAGVCIAFSMECYEKGLLTKDQTNGLELTFGNTDAMLALLKDICDRKGFGDILAEGIQKAAEFVGKGSEAFAMHVKGMSLPVHEPRAKTGVGLAFAVSASGPDHMELQHDPVLATEGGVAIYAALGFTETLDCLDLSIKKVRQFLYLQWLYNMYNSIGICHFVQKPVGPFTINTLVEYIQAVTGWDTSLWELMKVGSRQSTMARMFNIREGWTLEDDSLPPRMFAPLEGDGPSKGAAIDREEFEKAKRAYYILSGWTDDGIPRSETLGELGLDWIQ